MVSVFTPTSEGVSTTQAVLANRGRGAMLYGVVTVSGQESQSYYYPSRRGGQANV